jgi:hypothetical protein
MPGPHAGRLVSGLPGAILPGGGLPAVGLRGARRRPAYSLRQPAASLILSRRRFKPAGISDAGNPSRAQLA